MLVGSFGAGLVGQVKYQLYILNAREAKQLQVDKEKQEKLAELALAEAKLEEKKAAEFKLLEQKNAISELNKRLAVQEQKLLQDKETSKLEIDVYKAAAIKSEAEKISQQELHNLQLQKFEEKLAAHDQRLRFQEATSHNVEEGTSKFNLEHNKNNQNNQRLILDVDASSSIITPLKPDSAQTALQKILELDRLGLRKGLNPIWDTIGATFLDDDTLQMIAAQRLYEQAKSESKNLEEQIAKGHNFDVVDVPSSPERKGYSFDEVDVPKVPSKRPFPPSPYKMQ
jgi:hypothetical protein